MISRLLEFKSKLDRITKESFLSAASALEAVKKSFQNFINKRHNKPAELVARFIDGLLRRKGGSSGEGGLEETLDRLLVLFRFIQGKDVFEAFYQKDLARRLLLGKLSSLETEQYLVRLLKVECGRNGFNCVRWNVYSKVGTNV